MYPLKRGKKAAWAKWQRMTAEEESKALAALPTFDFGDDPKFIPHPATWLNQGRWDDEQFQKPERRPVVPRTGDLTDCPNCDGNGWIWGDDGEQHDCDPCHGVGKVMVS